MMNQMKRSGSEYPRQRSRTEYITINLSYDKVRSGGSLERDWTILTTRGDRFREVTWWATRITWTSDEEGTYMNSITVKLVL